MTLFFKESQKIPDIFRGKIFKVQIFDASARVIGNEPQEQHDCARDNFELNAGSTRA